MNLPKTYMESKVESLQAQLEASQKQCSAMRAAILLEVEQLKTDGHDLQTSAAECEQCATLQRLASLIETYACRKSSQP